jgi:chromosomal replication initiation ATPase DnaA
MQSDQREIIEKIAHNMSTDIDDLLSAVQIVFNCTLDDLKSHRRDNDLPYARCIFFYYGDKIFSRDKKCSKQHLGELLNRKKSDVFYSINAFKNRNNKKTNNIFYQYVKRVTALLNGRWFIE